MDGLLGKRGYYVITAEDGLSALDLLKQHNPEIIFIDLIMPNIGGEKLCRIIRTLPDFEKTYIIILSAIAAEDEFNYRCSGANACIAKGPFDNMGKRIIRLLDNLEDCDFKSNYPETLGLEDVFSRNITVELLSSQRHFEVMLGNMSEGVLELTLDGRIIYANPAAISVIGLPEEKLLARDFTKLFSGKDHDRIKKLLIDSLQKPQELTETAPLRRENKEIALHILSIKDKENRSTIIIMKDVTEQNRMRSQLQRAQKMESVGTLAGGVAHDLNNILSGLVSYPELLYIRTDNRYIDRPIRGYDDISEGNHSKWFYKDYAGKRSTEAGCGTLSKKTVYAGKYWPCYPRRT